MVRYIGGAVVVSVLMVLGFLGCGGRPDFHEPTSDLGIVAGRVIKGSVQSATVTVYRLEGAQRAASVGTATTDAEGNFRVLVGTATGPFLVVASGGSFIDEATGVTVKLNAAELMAIIPAFDVETKIENLRITPVSHLAAGLTFFWMRSEQRNVLDASAEAWQRLNAHFGNLDWRLATPTDVTSTMGATLDEPTKQGLLLASLSMQARLMAQSAGLTPGGSINPLVLTQALYDDVTADGFFDGLGAAGRLVMPPGGTVTDAGTTATPLDGQTLRGGLAQAIAKFVSSDRNVTRITVADAQQLLAALAANTDARLFRSGSGGGAADIESPVITFVKPSVDMMGAAGSFEVEVSATDNVSLKSLVFTAPSALTSTVAVPGADGKSAVLKQTFNVSSLPEGAVVISVKATDAANNESTKSVSLVVANNGPTISVSAPGDATTVKNIVAITATATAKQGSLRKLELVNAPPGCGADQLPAADSFVATWDTTRTPEGPLQLIFHAEDSFGTPTDVLVSVVVDNVAFGAISTQVFAGAPVSGAMVKLVAVDSAGQPLDGGGLLGQGGPTDVEGKASFALTVENYEGPVQLVASGAGRSYVDPIDGTTIVNIPATLNLTSYVASYRSGAALDLPVTYWTTLADASASMLASGRHPSSSAPRALATAMVTVDSAFTTHISGASRPWSLRSVRPVSLTEPPTRTFNDAVYAALPGIALDALARNIAAKTGLSGGTGYTAPDVVSRLVEDISSDGLLDGKIAGVPYSTPTTPPYAYRANTTRVELAEALDTFVLSDRNKSGITGTDFRSAGIYDTITGDTNALLYPSDQPVDVFDVTGPAITLTVSYQLAATSPAGQAPVGASLMVGGVVTVLAEAKDPSGVRSVTLNAAGQPLTTVPPAAYICPVGSTCYKGTFTTTADGPLTFTANSIDNRNNPSTKAVTVLVDNTAPAINVTKPVQGFYSSTVEVEATATDANNSVTSLTAAGFDGLSDQDGTPARFFANYTLPVGPDGAKTVTFTGCDVVGNCRNASASITVDRTAPTVAVVTAPPRYTNRATVAFVVSASDSGAGVRRVLVRPSGSATAPAVEGTPMGSGQWSFDAVAVTAGNNTLRVWAEDLATPSNSGSETASQNISVTVDTQMATPTLESAASYIDERRMTLTSSSPVAYGFESGAAKTTLTPNAHIYKAITRTAATNMNVDEFEGTNPRNIPFVRFAVPYNSNTESPIASGEIGMWIQGCSSCAGATVSAIRGAQRSDGVIPFYVPITSTVLPAILTHPVSPVPVEFVFTVRDAAGNSAQTASVVLNFHIIGPPLEVSEDTNYASAGDVRSIYGYRLSSGTYHLTWLTPSAVVNDASGSHYSVRVVRYVVRNPHAVAIALPVSSAASYSINETWNTETYVMSSFSIDNMAFNQRERWGQWEVPGANPPLAGFPCPGVTAGANHAFNSYAFHTPGSTTRFNCQGVPYPTPVTNSAPVVAAGGTMAIWAFSSPQTGGGERTVAASVAGVSGANYVLVPAGASVAIYGERDVNLPRFINALNYGAYGNPTSAYRSLIRDFYKQVSFEGCEGGPACGNFDAWRWASVLSAVTETMSGSISFRSSALRSDGKAYEDLKDLSTLTINKSYGF